MTWEVDLEAVEVTLEKMWELHDRISNAIHLASMSNFRKVGFLRGGEEDLKDGCAFVKGLNQDEKSAAFSDVRSLDGIRTALEDLEDQLEFLHVKYIPPLLSLSLSVCRF